MGAKTIIVGSSSIPAENSFFVLLIVLTEPKDSIGALISKKFFRLSRFKRNELVAKQSQLETENQGHAAENKYNENSNTLQFKVSPVQVGLDAKFFQ